MCVRSMYISHSHSTSEPPAAVPTPFPHSRLSGFCGLALSQKLHEFHPPMIYSCTRDTFWKIPTFILITYLLSLGSRCGRAHTFKTFFSCVVFEYSHRDRYGIYSEWTLIIPLHRPIKFIATPQIGIVVCFDWWWKIDVQWWLLLL